MEDLSHLTTEEQRAALAAGVGAVEQIQTMIHQLEYLQTVQLAGLTRLASRIARDEGHADHGELVHRAIEAEVSVATRTGHITVATRMGHADQLLDRYPAVSAAFAEGRVSLRHTEVIVDAGQIIQTPDSRAAYAAEVLPIALHSTVRQLRTQARRLAEHFAERGIDERHREARKQRSVTVADLDDGMACLTARIGAVEAYAIKDRLARIAHHARARGAGSDAAHGHPAAHPHTAAHQPPCQHPDEADPRTARQIQADVFTELLLTGTAPMTAASTSSSTPPGGGATGRGDPLSSITGRVQITVPVLTLAGGGRSTGEGGHRWAGPAELAGYGPIDTHTARRLAGNAPGWDRVLTHPVDGAVLAVDRYRPSEDLKRALGARDQHCRFPGCTRRLDHCDIDHTIPAARGGPTELGNMSHLCRRHHTLKHFEFLNGSGWKPKQRPGGTLEWASPTGRTYTDTPSSTVTFAPVDPELRRRTNASTEAPPGTGTEGDEDRRGSRVPAEHDTRSAA